MVRGTDREKRIQSTARLFYPALLEPSLPASAAALVYPRVQAALGKAGNWACGFGLMAVGFAILQGDKPWCGKRIACP